MQFWHCALTISPGRDRSRRDRSTKCRRDPLDETVGEVDDKRHESTGIGLLACLAAPVAAANQAVRQEWPVAPSPVAPASATREPASPLLTASAVGTVAATPAAVTPRSSTRCAAPHDRDSRGGSAASAEDDDVDPRTRRQPASPATEDTRPPHGECRRRPSPQGRCAAGWAPRSS